MSEAHHPTLRQLARSLGLAPATVSDALRGTGRVAASTVRRVRKAAREAGYKANPLTATVLSEVRRRRGHGFRGTIAVIDLYEPIHWPHGPFPREMIAGARKRAAAMGFSLEEFTVGTPQLGLARLNTMLPSRGIHGVIVLPSWAAPDLSGLDWSRYAGIYTDYVTTRPALHSVCSDHYGSMMALMELLAERGYRRPGLILERGRDERIKHRQSAAFRAFLATRPDFDPVPVLITPGIPRETEDFAPWFALYRPDVVLSHLPETQGWIGRHRPARSPAAGFVLLNRVEQREPCAALDLQPRELGARAAELVVGQLLRNDFGPPDWPTLTALKARWVEGPTVRPARS